MLFQYGSNMDARVLSEKIRVYHGRYALSDTPVEAVFRGAARLPGWRFGFGLYSLGLNGRVADVVAAGPEDEVWGALYELPRELVLRADGRRSVMDRIEGHRTERDPENYEPARVFVEYGEGSVEAWTYVGGEIARRRCLKQHAAATVSDEYAATILAGAAGAGLPDDYRAHLQKMIAACQGSGGIAPEPSSSETERWRAGRWR